MRENLVRPVKTYTQIVEKSSLFVKDCWLPSSFGPNLRILTQLGLGPLFSNNVFSLGAVWSHRLSSGAMMIITNIFEGSLHVRYSP